MAGVDSGYVVDYNVLTNEFTNWTSFSYNNQREIATHFDGISNSECCGYNLTGVAITLKGQIAFAAHISRDENSKFYKKAKWEEIVVPNQILTTGNSIALNTVIGISSQDGHTVNGYVSILI